MALEQICGIAPPPRALFLRALLLERERIANHLGDLGGLGNDAGFAFGLAQFSRLKEDVLRTNLELFGHRYLMDRIVPGGVTRDLDETGAAHKPFVVPQRDPAHYDSLLETYSVPELVNGPVDASRWRLAQAARAEPSIATDMPITGATPKTVPSDPWQERE